MKSKINIVQFIDWRCFFFFIIDTCGVLKKGLPEKGPTKFHFSRDYWLFYTAISRKVVGENGIVVCTFSYNLSRNSCIPVMYFSLRSRLVYFPLTLTEQYLRSKRSFPLSCEQGHQQEVWVHKMRSCHQRKEWLTKWKWEERAYVW